MWDCDRQPYRIVAVVAATIAILPIMPGRAHTQVVVVRPSVRPPSIEFRIDPIPGLRTDASPWKFSNNAQFELFDSSRVPDSTDLGIFKDDMLKHYPEAYCSYIFLKSKMRKQYDARPCVKNNGITKDLTIDEQRITIDQANDFLRRMTDTANSQATVSPLKIEPVSTTKPSYDWSDLLRSLSLMWDHVATSLFIVGVVFLSVYALSIAYLRFRFGRLLWHGRGHLPMRQAAEQRRIRIREYLEGEEVHWAFSEYHSTRPEARLELSRDAKLAHRVTLRWEMKSPASLLAGRATELLGFLGELNSVSAVKLVRMPKWYEWLTTHKIALVIESSDSRTRLALRVNNGRSLLPLPIFARRSHVFAEYRGCASLGGSVGEVGGEVAANGSTFLVTCAHAVDESCGHTVYRTPIEQVSYCPDVAILRRDTGCFGSPIAISKLEPTANGAEDILRDCGRLSLEKAPQLNGKGMMLDIVRYAQYSGRVHFFRI